MIGVGEKFKKMVILQSGEQCSLHEVMEVITRQQFDEMVNSGCPSPGGGARPSQEAAYVAHFGHGELIYLSSMSRRYVAWVFTGNRYPDKFWQKWVCERHFVR